MRVTHVATGITARSMDVAPGRNAGARMAWYREKAVGLLLARLNRPAQTQIERTYHLAPRPGIEPHIKQDGRWLATGIDEVLEFLNGKR